MQTKVFGRRDFLAFYEVIVKIPVRFEAAKLRDIFQIVCFVVHHRNGVFQSNVVYISYDVYVHFVFEQRLQIRRA